MRGKGTLSLLEQSVMLLIFAVAAALCLKGFAAAELTARENERLSEAVLQGRNVAEQLKHSRGEWDGVQSIPGCVVTVHRQESEVENLGKAEVMIADETGKMLFVLPVAWQEVDGREG